MAIKVGEKDLFPYLGDYGPVSIYKGEQKLAGYKWAEKSGQELHFDNTYNSHVEVEVDGKSYQHAEPTPDYPIEIYSLNNFDVVSSVGGRNYFSVSFFGSVEGISNPFYSGETDYVYTLEPDTYYTLSTTAPPRDSSGSTYIHFGNFPLSASSRSNGVVRGSPKTILTNSEGKISITINRMDTQQTISRIINGDYKIRLEKGTKATDWTPAPEDITESDNHLLIDKINLSLSEPLRSVGDVKDRLFKDSDGLWKVERNVGEAVFDGTESWRIWHSRDTSSMFGLHSEYLEEPMLKRSGLVVSNMFPSMIVNSSDEEGINIGTRPRLRVRAFYERVGTTTDSTDDEKINSFKQWLSNTYTEGVPLAIVYEVETPTIETLDPELQHQLNTLKSFHESNYVYTVLSDDDLTPTIHAKTEVKDI